MPQARCCAPLPHFEEAIRFVEPFPGVFRGGAGVAVHGLDHEIEGGVGAVGAFVVVAGFGEAAGGEGEDDFAGLEAVGGEDGDAVEVGGLAPAVDAEADEEGADFHEAGLVVIPDSGIAPRMIFCGLMVAGELDGFVEGEALVAGDDLEGVAVES